MAFDLAEAALLEEMGGVSIVKFLGGETEAEAQERWFGAMEAFLDAVPEGVYEGLDLSSDRPVLTFRDGVALEVDLYELLSRPTVSDAWRAMMKPGLAPLVVDAVADVRWGETWASALQDAIGESALPVKSATEPFGSWAWSVHDDLVARGDAARARGWLVRAGPQFAPAPWFTDERRARRAAAAIAVGSDAVARIYRTLEES